MLKKMFCRVIVFVVVLLINGGIAWGQINLIENGDFEAGDTGWTEWSSPGGWTNDTFVHDYGSACDIWIPSPYPYEGASTHCQTRGVVNIHGGLYQVIDVVPGVTYTVSGTWAGGVGGLSEFDPNNPPPSWTAWFEVTIYDGAATVGQIDAAPGPNDVLIAKRENVGYEPYNFNWELFSGQFTAQSNQVTLAMKTGKSGGLWDAIAAYHDEIAIEAPHSSSIPTMTEWGKIIFTLVLGFSAIWYIRKKGQEGSMA